MNAGDGADTIVMTEAQANALVGSSAFNTAFTNFEKLSLTTVTGGSSRFRYNQWC